MNFFTKIGGYLSDDRLLFNLIAIHALLGATLVVSIILRRLLVHGSKHVVHMTGMRWLHGVSDEAAKRIRPVLFWLTLGVMATIVLGGLGYHYFQNDIRQDIKAWYANLTWAEAKSMFLATVELVFLGIGSWFVARQVRRLLPWLHEQIGHWFGKSKEDSIRWFGILERYAITLLVLGFFWCAGHIVGLGTAADRYIGLLVHILTILAVAHLLTLSCRALSHGLATLGERHLGNSQYRRYWERVTRLFPFGERCFEAAVYVSAASLCFRELQFILFIANFGPRIVECIGIFFGTRVLIELLQVLLNEAFHMNEEDRAMDQKGQTLVPLLQSIGQYVLYFGSGVMMLSVLGISTSPILAGAGILGLAGAFGAQSLVTDVVSGFFILFENQYLVGDYVKIADATGKVEAVSIRTTQVRDDQGRLNIIPNGQIKGVINYSKNYVIAEVDIKVPADKNVGDIFRAMAEAGRRVRQSHREVMADTVIKGLVDLSASDMIVRATTKVQAGTHLPMQFEYRRLLKEVLDEQKTPATPTIANPPAMAA
ncbi:MAG TPA: mechanosensitive ion channel family protein, partial [Gemmataceae bacterium]|nr:mechanosensitive ion channel family protein [Gemmataceae bacterium]